MEDKELFELINTNALFSEEIAAITEKICLLTMKPVSKETAEDLVHRFQLIRKGLMEQNKKLIEHFSSQIDQKANHLLTATQEVENVQNEENHFYELIDQVMYTDNCRAPLPGDLSDSPIR